MEFEDVKDIEFQVDSPKPLKFDWNELNDCCKEESGIKTEAVDLPVSDDFISLDDCDCKGNLGPYKFIPRPIKICDDSKPDDEVVKCENEVDNCEQDSAHGSDFTYGGSVENFLGNNSHIFDKIWESSLEQNSKQRRRGFVKCEYCERSYRGKGDLKRHVESFHLNLKNFRCEVCNIVFSRKSSMQKHYNKYHLKNKTFRCSICPYQGGSKYHLRRHQSYVHGTLNLLTYFCAYCDFNTKYQVSIKKHLDSKHLLLFTSNFEEPNGQNSKKKKPVRRKLILCPHCEYSAKDRSRLDGHINSKHKNINPYKCNFCSYNTTHSERLKAHTKCKHKMKYKCHLCTLTFKTKNLLSYHKLNVHFSNLVIALEQYICYYCYQSYHCKDNLLRHIRLLHPNKFLK